jgi:hypothetical protein
MSKKTRRTWLQYEVLMVMNMKMALFRNVASCSQVDTDGRFRGTYRLNRAMNFSLYDKNADLLSDKDASHVAALKA